MHDMKRLIGKTAVITGGATGIGLAAAKRFIEEGALVFIFGRRQEALDAAVAELGPNARAVKGSVSDEADLDRLYAAVKAERGTLAMNIENNVQTVKDFFAAMGRGDKHGLLALSAEDIEWIIPGKDWPLAGTHRGHAGLTTLLQKASEMVETSTEPSEYVAQGDRVLVVGVAKGKIKVTNKTFDDDWIFAITVRNGKVANIREYVDTQALARASEMDASPGINPSKQTPHETIRKIS
jgi:uncharacterized protein